MSISRWLRTNKIIKHDNLIMFHKEASLLMFYWNVMIFTFIYTHKMV